MILAWVFIIVRVAIVALAIGVCIYVELTDDKDDKYNRHC